MKLILLLAFVTAAACAQPLQNNDIFWMYGGVPAGAHAIPGTNVVIPGFTTRGLSVGYGYQIGRRSAATLIAEYATSILSGCTHDPVVAVACYGSTIHLLGLRLVAPVHARVSLYGTLGGGAGSFKYDTQGATGPSTARTWHGVVVPGAGLDIRLSRMFSIRVEARDYITGRGLSGVAGRHHVFPAAGIAMHF